MWPWVSYLNSLGLSFPVWEMRIAIRPLLTTGQRGVIRSGRGCKAPSPACGKTVWPCAPRFWMSVGSGAWVWPPLVRSRELTLFHLRVWTCNQRRIWEYGWEALEPRDAALSLLPLTQSWLWPHAYPSGLTWAGLACSEMLRTTYLRPGQPPPHPPAADAAHQWGAWTDSWTEPELLHPRKESITQGPSQTCFWLTFWKTLRIFTGRQAPPTQGRLSMGCTQGVWLLTVRTVWNP